MLRWFTTSCLLLLVLGATRAEAVTFNHVVTLGDSLLDDSGGGRSPVAAEHVAERLGVPLTKFALSGSTSTDMIVDGQHTQAAAQFGAGDLAMMWIGGNDFFDSALELAVGNDDFLVTLEANASTAVAELRSGGLDVALFNLPDMSKVPGVINVVETFVFPFLRDGVYRRITDATVAWNSHLDALAGDDNQITVIDVFDVFEQLAADPSAFSLLGNDPILNADSGCQFCVFFDDFLLPDVHPSSFAQGFVANEAIATLNEVYDPAGTMPLESLSIVEIALLAHVYGGDFDGNGTVDGNDLSEWQSDFGSLGVDADGDGDTDGADFLVWQTQLQGSLLSSSQAVPEPATATLALMLLTVYLSRRAEKF